MASSAADQLSVMSISVKSKQSAEEKKEPEEEIMFCSSCGETGDTLKKCVACKCVFYCGVMCQKAHRDAHKTECKLVKKILKKKEKEFDPWKQTSDPDQREFNDLMEECIDEKLAEFAAKYGHTEEFEGLTFLEKTQALMAITTFDEEKGDEAFEGIDSLMGRNLAPSISSIIHDGFVPLNPPPRKCCAACNKMMPPLDNFMTTYVPCCGKIVCTGCATEQADILMESNKRGQ